MRQRSESFHLYVGHVSRAGYEWIWLASADSQETNRSSADVSTGGAEVLSYFKVLGETNSIRVLFTGAESSYAGTQGVHNEDGAIYGSECVFQSVHEQKLKSTSKSATPQSPAGKPTSSCSVVNVQESDNKLLSTPVGQR